MTADLTTLIIAAASIGLIHTLAGPDHYLPFIVMSRARGWSWARTALVTAAAGVGHVASSIVLGLIGIGLGVAVGRLEVAESYRGELAAWALICFGLVYMVWGIRRAMKKRPHTHLGVRHAADDSGRHTHVVDEQARDLTPWVLFTIFVLGPCEPLIPLLMYPAAQNDIGSVVAVATAFGVTTIGTMLTIVVAATLGLKPVRFEKLAPFAHSMAGGAILASGLAIQLLGL